MRISDDVAQNQINWQTFVFRFITMSNFCFLIIFSILLTACSSGSVGKIETITIENTGDKNALMKMVKIRCAKSVDAYVEYWLENKPERKFITPISRNKQQHDICLTNLDFEKIFQCRITIINDNDSLKSEPCTFRTPNLPETFLDAHVIREAQENDVPQEFLSGCLLLYKRDTPGYIILLDHNGNIRWYKNIKTRGVKVAHYTQQKTILSLLSASDHPNSYGDEILELSLTGDTICHLNKGEKDFQQTIHHEILLNHKNQIVTLSVLDKVMDLSSARGGQADTVRGDGITVLNRKGEKVWGWSIFDELNPLVEKNIINERKDWMHANSLCVDGQGNYIVSFYNNGQIWKIDSQTGKVIWKFGRNGNYFVPRAARISNVHAAHIDTDNCLRFFDNGVAQRQSQAWAFSIDEKSKQVEVKGNTKLPKGIYTDRMGSAYKIGKNTLLICVSKQHYIYLTRFNGDILWKMFCVNTPYRAEFIPMSDLSPFITN